MVKVSEHAGENGKKAGSMLLKMSFALVIMVGVIKLAGKLEAGEIVKGTIVVGVLGVLFKAIVKVSQYAGEHGAKAGSMILKISIALMAMVGVIKLISYISHMVAVPRLIDLRRDRKKNLNHQFFHMMTLFSKPEGMQTLYLRLCVIFWKNIICNTGGLSG